MNTIYMICVFLTTLVKNKNVLRLRGNFHDLYVKWHICKGRRRGGKRGLGSAHSYQFDNGSFSQPPVSFCKEEGCCFFSFMCSRGRIWSRVCWLGVKQGGLLVVGVSVQVL